MHLRHPVLQAADYHAADLGMVTVQCVAAAGIVPVTALLVKHVVSTVVNASK